MESLEDDDCVRGLVSETRSVNGIHIALMIQSPWKHSLWLVYRLFVGTAGNWGRLYNLGGWEGGEDTPWSCNCRRGFQVLEAVELYRDGEDTASGVGLGLEAPGRSRMLQEGL